MVQLNHENERGVFLYPKGEQRIGVHRKGWWKWCKSRVDRFLPTPNQGYNSMLCITLSCSWDLYIKLQRKIVALKWHFWKVGSVDQIFKEISFFLRHPQSTQKLNIWVHFWLLLSKTPNLNRIECLPNYISLTFIFDNGWFLRAT